ncbi:dihydroneopterin aldolase family protein [Methanobrevibacter curvatus]|uniref:Dihydroneopterin aldolase n=1 Tax=Methanobrevibacter curvatus TaxID=49547 RepID=A0A166DL62_9EURY|nr:dihydroneopterin aldolase family protein [Methanobrevibacter curvatus]KZX15712.1 hypothetical protein MBCUR_02040 [Methanobrevibacter curvatus]
MNLEEKYFSNITSRERAIFEGAISMGALFHQFIGTPVSVNTAKDLELSISKSFQLQPAIESVNISINLKKLEEENTEFNYVSLSGEMLDVEITSKVADVKAIIKIEFIEELNYPLMYVKKIIE